MPTPVLQFDGTEDYQAQGKAMVRYKLSVVNRAGFVGELFGPAPDLPPCGANTKASRTWVDVLDGEQAGVTLYAFCALASTEELGKLWFSLPKATQPPRTVLIAVTDRRNKTRVTSNRVQIPGQSAAPGASAALWDKCQRQANEQGLRACTEIIEGKSETGLKLAQAYSMRAVALQNLGRRDDAIADIGKTIELMQEAGKGGWDLAFMYFLRANTHRTKGDLERAIADHTEAIRIAPGWDKSYNGRGAIYLQKGDIENALADISKVISFRPDSPRVADSYAIRAMLYLRMEQPAKALPDAERAVELSPRSALALYIRAKVYETLGRAEEAAASKRAALEIDASIQQQVEALEQAGKR